LSLRTTSFSTTTQQQGGVEMDSLVSGVKKFIKDYGKKNGYSYIYGTEMQQL
jgi:outer membrane protein